MLLICMVGTFSDGIGCDEVITPEPLWRINWTMVLAYLLGRVE
jgi:hypothetical protein